MNSQTAVEAALRLITPAPSEDEKLRWRTTLNTLINPALVEFADQQAASDDRELRALLRKTFQVVVADSEGFATLEDLLNAAEPILLKYLNNAEIYLEGVTRQVTLLPDQSTLQLERPAGFPFASLIGHVLKIRNGGEAFVGNVTITGSFVPALTSIVGQLKEPYILVLHNLATHNTPSQPRTQAKELKAVAVESK